MSRKKTSVSAVSMMAVSGVYVAIPPEGFVGPENVPSKVPSGVPTAVDNAASSSDEGVLVATSNEIEVVVE